ncbi:hypothetical protein COLSTE_00322 [Collinsella stercoris DSM 13279]|uniref:Uncharacterized protein n=1 Tax=Collinsella stercoris DSM 13279 TaxID=445975 RepID=B6G8D2_9ACTN|nr:hypothetical protein COLSTE_00322 [Collinsella stercoris DSM 13279]
MAVARMPVACVCPSLEWSSSAHVRRPRMTIARMARASAALNMGFSRFCKNSCTLTPHHI